MWSVRIFISVLFVLCYIEYTCLILKMQCESESVSCSKVSDSLRPHGLYPTRLLCPWDSPGKNTGVGCHALLQRIFPTQRSNLGLLHFRQILYHLATRDSQSIIQRYIN